MKQLFFIISFSLCAIFAQAQFRLAVNGTPSWTNLGGGLYSATMTFHADLTGNSYAVAGIVDTMRLFTSRGQVFEVDSVWGKTFSQATLRVEYVSGVNSAPVGQGMVYAPNPNGFVPDLPFGSTGATAQFNQMPVTYNASLTAAGGGGTVTSVGLTMPSGFSVSNSPVTTAGTIGVTTTLNGLLRGNGSGFTTGNANLASEVTGTLPTGNGGTGLTTIGTAGQVLRVNSGATGLEYGTISASPAGSNGQVQFNNSGAFGADAALHWDNTNKGLGIGATTLGDARLVLKNTQEPVRTTVVSTQTFADNTGWTEGTGWSITGGVAAATAATGALTYTGALTITSGNAYEVTYTLTGYTAGTLTLAVGNATYTIPSHNATANVVVVLPTSATGGFRFTTSTFTGNLDNVSIVEISQPATILLSGQDDGSTTAYFPMSMPNSSTIVSGGGGRYITGTQNVANGYRALYSNTTGYNNTATGGNALYSNTTGTQNVANGYQALASNTTGNNNTANGFRALYSNTTGSNNTAQGRDALYYNTTGGANTATGGNALFYNTTGSNNVANGYQALASNTTGNNNTANGFRALYSNTTGGANTAQGRDALYSNTTGTQNVANGYQALASNTTGSDNTANGLSALYSNTTGYRNSAVGYQSLYSNTTGNQNTALGYQAGRYITGSSENTSATNSVFVGAATKAAAINQTNQIVIGHGATGLGDSTAVLGAAMKKVRLGDNLTFKTDQSIGAGQDNYVLTYDHSAGTVSLEASASKDTVFISLIAAKPGVAVTQTAGHDYYDATFLVPNYLDGFNLARVDYAMTNSTATTGSWTVGIRLMSTTNVTVTANGCAVTFNAGDVRASSSGGLSVSKNQWLYVETHPSVAGTLDGTNEGLLATLMFVK